MNKMTWLDLYNYLHAQANGLDNFGRFDWNSPVMIHDASTGEELSCDTWVISNHIGNNRTVLATNIESIFAENNGANP